MNKQLALAVQLNDEATLTDFNWENNALLQKELNGILSHHTERFLYLWGPKGSGKSHILQGCCQALQTSETAMYLPLHLLQEWGPQTIEGLEEQTLVCIDDIDCIAKDRKSVV